MNAALFSIALLTLASAAVALSLRNLIHSVLLLIASWAGVAAFYLWAGAEFVGFAQMLVYVGAVSMVVLFAVLLTRARAEAVAPRRSFVRALGAVVVSGIAFATLAYAVLKTPMRVTPSSAPIITVRQLGMELMGTHIVGVLIVGVILTVALLGGIVIASASRAENQEDAP
jgi:NADH:ubiquinone oxidoreductase subunit 6 (subunit J)